MYFPNISLCENGCEIIGVNLTTLQAICECSFNFLRDNIILSNNFFYQSLIGQIEELINNTYIWIIKCYKDIFKYKYFISSYGGFIILGLIFFQIIFTIIYSSKSLYSIRKYILSITNKYLIYLIYHKNKLQLLSNNALSPSDNNSTRNKEPPKKNIFL